MATKTLTGKPYEPSYEIRETVKRMIAHNFSMATIMGYIINPETEKPLSKATFEKVFAEEMRTARVERVEVVSSVIFDKAMEGDLQACRAIINLQGKGLFNKRFELNTNAPIHEQLNQVLQAGASGLISSEEVANYCNAIKLKSETMLDKIITLLKPLVDEQTLNSVLGTADAGQANDRA